MTVVATVGLVTGHPLFGLGLTVAVYCAADRAYVALGRPPLLHPVLVSVAVIAGVVTATGLEYARYFAQAAPLHQALGLFVVLLAVPLVRRLGLICASGPVVVAALFIGSVVAIASAVALPIALAEPQTLVASLAPKSATAAVAVGIAERLGGAPGLTAMLAVMTGLFGSVVGPSLLTAAGVRDERAFGFAMGLASHAIGTARAFQVSDTAGAFASLGMILNALLTVVLAPLALAALPQ